MFVYTLVILTELLLHKYIVFFYNYYLQPFAECRVNSYKQSAYFSSKSSPVWFILVSWQPYVVHVIAFGFVAKCLETEVHDAKFHPKAQVLSKWESLSGMKCVCSGDMLLQKIWYGLKAIVFFTLKAAELFITVQNNIQVKLSVSSISVEDCAILL